MANELTASEENAVNFHNDTMNLAINKVMGLETQTYDDFINGFQHITKESISFQKKSSVVNQVTNTSNTVACESKKASMVKLEPCKTGTDQGSDGELEEEVLDNGTTVDSTLRTPTVKFDNFVDEEVSDDDLSSETPGYVASFGGEAVNTNGVLIQDNTEKTEEIKDTEKTEEIKEEDEILKKDLNDKLCHSSETPSDNELEGPDTKSEIVVEKKLSEHYSSSSLPDDLTENANVENENKEVVSHQVALYPGEADPDLKELEMEMTHTQLDFTTVKCDSISCEQTEQICTDCSDEVQPFSLDEDFDYDNVTLTPKFTAHEVEYLKSFLPRNDVTT